VRLYRRLLGRGETQPPFPPDGLMFMGETEERSVRTGDELLSLAEGRFDPKGLVFDVGCGYGRLAYALERSGFEGDYLGLDVKKKSIDWLTENFTAAAPRFRFTHADVRNDRYNPAGSLSGDSFRLPDPPRPPALVLVLSVFTHMYEADVRRYLHEIARLSDADTLVYVTFFLLNDEQRRLEVEGNPKWTFPHALSGHCRVHSIDNPLHVVGYAEDWVLSAIDDAGLRLEEKVYGWWSGRQPRPKLGQDSLLLRLA
jgi:SAM-dependent methyltransferase